jgi:hypothetical protein
MDNFQFGYKQKLPKKKKKKPLELLLAHCLCAAHCWGEGGGQQRENGQAAWAPQPPPCVLAGNSQSGRAAKKGKEGRSKLLSLSLVVARDLSLLFSLFC